MSYQVVKGDKRNPSYATFDAWMKEVGETWRKWHQYDEDYEPFSENEVSGVSILLSAAARVGYLAISEYEIEKLSNPGQPGRGDLWFTDTDQSYAFEFKRSWRNSNKSQLEANWALAIGDAGDVPPNEADQVYAGLIAPLYSPSKDSIKKHKEPMKEHKDLIAAHKKALEADFIFAIGESRSPSAFIYLKAVLCSSNP